jgi:enolase-phosphatase E1
MSLAARGVLLDIEGTTSSISFVYDRMFPLVRRDVDAFLEAHWDAPEVVAAREQLAKDAERHVPSDRTWVSAEATRLMDADAKTTGLKQLQGLIWKSAFESGELEAHLFDDVPPALRSWREAGVDLRIYSSGSIAAQKLFFGHTIAGDLLPLFSGFYDTTTGPKRESGSYASIATDWQLPPMSIVFASDTPAELDAARAAGMPTVLVNRPGNAPVPDDCDHPAIESFVELNVTSG